MRSTAGYDAALGLIAKRLRGDTDDVAHEALPKRWVDLIRYLDEQERKSLERAQSAAAEANCPTEAEAAIRIQEKVLQELLRIEEPTEEAAALLEELRRRVARAVAE